MKMCLTLLMDDNSLTIEKTFRRIFMIKYTISIVSHKSGHLIAKLFIDLKRTFPIDSELVLTINTPEDETYIQILHDMAPIVIRNITPLGFGENHNRAFNIAKGNKFIIINPDVRIESSPWECLDAAFENNVGVCAPTIRTSAGSIVDSPRFYPTIIRLFKRLLFSTRSPDYIAPSDLKSVEVEWVAGMFVMFDSTCFRLIGGFDTRYYMYVEDIDICHRLNLAGKKVLWVPNCFVVHDGQRASRKIWKNQLWHIRSMIRFLFGL